MNHRLLNSIAIGFVSLVALGAIVVVVLDRRKPPPPPSPPDSGFRLTTAATPAFPKEVQGTSAVAASQPGGKLSANQPPEQTKRAKSEPSEPSSPPKIYTWAEVEAELQKLRDGRDKSPMYWAELSGWYANLSDPKFTQSKDYTEHLKKLATWRDEFPESPTPLVVLARSYIRYAWDARGVGTSNTVSEVGWELYGQRVEEAHRLLEESLKLGAKDGEVFTRLVEVAKAASLPVEQTRTWVEEGRKVDPTYYPLYQSMAEYLLPRWHGEPGDIEKFAGDLVEQMPGDDGLIAFALVAQQITYYDCPGSLSLFWGQYDKQLLSQAAEALVKRYPHFPRLVSFAAVCTLAAQDHAAARRIRPLVGAYDPEDRIWLWINTHREFLD